MPIFVGELLGEALVVYFAAPTEEPLPEIFDVLLKQIDEDEGSSGKSDHGPWNRKIVVRVP